VCRDLCLKIPHQFKYYRLYRRYYRADAQSFYVYTSR
jgi:hypothetical protein